VHAARPGGIRRGLLRAVAVAILILLIGATYQGVTTALERRRFPHPGRMVRATDHQLHIDCTGEGSPTVVLEAPAAAMSAAWGWIQSELEHQTRVCSYDRSGMGWSEWGPRPYDPSRVPEELEALLRNSNERAPYVIVGHGLGAAFARLFASRYPMEVRAVVLIDVPKAGAGSKVRPLLAASPWLARAAFLRASPALARRARGLPGAAAGEMRSFLNRPDHLTRAAIEVAQWDHTVQLAESAAMGDVPLVTVDITGSDPLAFLSDRQAANQAVATISRVLAR
jgi:pimeloyl-ACP methyl ester carboxylesterase